MSSKSRNNWGQGKSDRARVRRSRRLSKVQPVQAPVRSCNPENDRKKVPKDSAAQLSADIRRDFPYESDNPRNVNYNADNNHNRDLDSDI